MPAPSPSADRNLLFGLLALQMDFVSRDQLIDAMNAWMLEKDRTLGEILCRGGGESGSKSLPRRDSCHERRGAHLPL
jgi:hypothetical protein